MNKKNIVALLPMKANSHRVKGKNFKEFCGKPLFHWILDTLLKITEIDQIIINTDARHILATNGLVNSDRIMIRDRKPEICGDLVSMNLILADDIAHVAADVYLMTHTTNPFLQIDTIRTALFTFQNAYKDNIADSLFTVNKVQTRFYRKDCTPVNHDPNNLVRTQDLEPWFEENSNLYIFTSDSFAKTSARIGEKPMMFESPEFESVDIDSPSDWNFAEVTAQYLKNNRNLQ
jgi:CMP-N-acetylneuraminic acid synthetase